MWHTGLVALWHVGSSQTRARTRVPCIGRRILNHCVTKEAPHPALNLILFLRISLSSPPLLPPCPSPCQQTALSRDHSAMPPTPVRARFDPGLFSWGFIGCWALSQENKGSSVWACGRLGALLSSIPLLLPGGSLRPPSSRLSHLLMSVSSEPWKEDLSHGTGPLATGPSDV